MVVGGASPEGTIPLNKRLSEKRANVLFDYLSQYGELPDSLTSFVYPLIRAIVGHRFR